MRLKVGKIWQLFNNPTRYKYENRLMRENTADFVMFNFIFCTRIFETLYISRFYCLMETLFLPSTTIPNTFRKYKKFRIIFRHFLKFSEFLANFAENLRKLQKVQKIYFLKIFLEYYLDMCTDEKNVDLLESVIETSEYSNKS